MIKSILTVIITLGIFFSISTYEQYYLANTFKEFNRLNKVVYEKIENQTATKDDVKVLHKFWINKKRTLHIFIPHGEIKEIELWISECIRYTQDKNFKEAISKLEVVIELAEELPKNYLIRTENIL